jgi:uncharacterized protein (DUF885 family)
VSSAFRGWLEAFFDAYYQQRPVNATFIGMHAHDDRQPDLSSAGQASIVSSADSLLARLRDLPTEPLTTTEQIDQKLAEGFLHIARWEASSAHFAWGNPSLFTGEAIFGVLSLLLRPFAPLRLRMDLTAARIAAIARLLDDGQSVLHDAPREWSARARRECAGAMLLLDRGIDTLLIEAGVEHAGLRAAAADARRAFARFDTFIDSALEPNASQAYACGAEALDLLLRRAHCLETDAAGLEQVALERIAEEEAAIATGRTPPEAASPRPYEGGSRAAYLDRFGELWRSARELARDRELVTFPDWPVRFVEQPEWVREAAPYFYFLPYRAPAPFDEAPVVDHFVPPNADESTIKLNHVAHHASLGHHVQNWHAARAESRIGQVAGVDCASRIALLCGGTMAEGWACYATDLADEAGFLTPAESFAQHNAHIRMAVRALVDIRLHQGRISLDDAADLYVQRVGMSRQAATAEAVKNSLSPGAACMYLAGWDGIHRLRQESRVDQGDSLREFHDQLLSFGSVPVSLVSRAMREAGAAPALANR